MRYYSERMKVPNVLDYLGVQKSFQQPRTDSLELNQLIEHSAPQSLNDGRHVIDHTAHMQAKILQLMSLFENRLIFVVIKVTASPNWVRLM